VEDAIDFSFLRFLKQQHFLKIAYLFTSLILFTQLQKDSLRDFLAGMDA
jgi:hypothetical protein